MQFFYVRLFKVVIFDIQIVSINLRNDQFTNMTYMK